MFQIIWGTLKRVSLILIKSSVFWTAIIQAAVLSFFPLVETYITNHPSLYGCFVLFIFMFMRLFILGGGLLIVSTMDRVKEKMNNNVTNIVLTMIIVFLCSCAGINQKLDPEVYYKRDMSIKVDGLKGDGVLVVPFKDKYAFEFKSKGELDLFTLTTCHRLHTQEDAGGFMSKKEVKYTYLPDPPMESTFACPIQVAGYDTNGSHSWGLIDIETKDVTLPAKIKCNGEAYNSTGASICQSKAGLMQSIEFGVEVVFSPEAQAIDFCKNIKYTTKDNKEFIYEIPRRECVYNFMEKNAPNREHRHTSIGFESVPIRK